MGVQGVGNILVFYGWCQADLSNSKDRCVELKRK